MNEQNKPKESERRQATVMFIDIAGFTEMSEKLDAEEVTNITNDCFEMMGEIIEHNGGTIDKFIGDNIMALFGVPNAIENSCNKALNTAIEIRNSLYGFNQNRNLKIPLDVHIGINTGKVIAGLVGSSKRKDYTVMGDTVNTAARLEDASTSGQILVGDLTYHEASHEFEFKTLQPITLKGKEKPVPVYELLSTKSIVSKPQIDTDRSIYSEMVGREEVFEALKYHVQDVINGKGTIVNVIGEPGIGKSRLIVELQKFENIRRVTFLKGAASSIGKDLSYHPIIEILQKWALIKEEDSAEEVLVKLEGMISTIDSEGTKEILPFIATLMGLKLEGNYAERVKGIEGEALEKLILKNLKDLLTKATEIRPIVFVVEDVHWADLTSIELLESLFRLADKHPILFVNVFRSDYKETSERLLETVKNKYPDNHSEIYLERLDVKQVELLVNNLLKSETLPVEVKTSISNRAEGNPLFVEEVLSSFIDEGVVRLDNGKFQVTEKIHSVVIPGSIQEVLMARLDLLDDENKSLLKKASVIGRYFFRKILGEITEHPEKINDQLVFLKEVQLIRERMRLKDIEYFFKHVLLQEVTYESILVQQRKALHLEVASAIEIVFPNRLNEFYGVLSWHYGRGEDLEKEEEYLIKAGEEAVKTGASNEAINYYKEALDLYVSKMGKTATDPEKIAKLEKGIATALYDKGRLSESLIYINKVLEYRGITIPINRIEKTLQLIHTSVSVIIHLYFLSNREGKVPEERVSEGLGLLLQKTWMLYATGSPEFMSAALTILRVLNKYDITKIKDGQFLYAFMSAVPSSTGISFKLSRKMLDYVNRQLYEDDAKFNIVYHFSERIHCCNGGEWINVTYEKSIVDQGLRIGSLNYSSGYLYWTGLILTELGNFSEAILCCESLYEIGGIYENNWSFTRKYLLNTTRFLKCRRLDDVVDEADQGIPFMQKAGYPFYALAALGGKGQAYILLNLMSEAEEALRQAREIVARHGNIRTNVLLYNWHLSQFLFDLYTLERAVESRDKLERSQVKVTIKSGKIALKTALKYAPGRTEVFKLMGLYYWLLDKQKKALKWWEKSIETGERLSARPELARTYMEVGKRLSSKKSKYDQLNDISSEEYLDKAEALFKKMELAWDLEELEKLRLINMAT